MNLKGKRLGCLLFIGLILLEVALVSAFIPNNECKSDIQGNGTWQRQADGSCYYIHTNYEFDRSNGCINCHNEPEQEFEFVPDLRIRIADDKLVSVLGVNGDMCTLWGGIIVPCDTLMKPPLMLPCPKPVMAME